MFALLPIKELDNIVAIFKRRSDKFPSDENFLGVDQRSMEP